MSTIDVFDCLYCGQRKPTDECSVEHAIPKFLGGAHAPNHFKLKNVCKRCNNILGLHVDASYARSWSVTNALAMNARELYTGLSSAPLPLVCMNIVDIPNLFIPADMVAEMWLGPSGEAIVWVRPEDRVLYWYSGGHPINRKRLPSKAYFFITTNDPVRLQMALQALHNAFKRTKVKCILGTKLAEGSDHKALPGFDVPTE